MHGWISAAEAKNRTVGKEKWWKKKGIGRKTVKWKQHDPTGPRNKPIWLWEDGGMYLGEWKVHGPKGSPVRHGFGIYCCSIDGKYKDWVYVGNWKDGEMHGPGKDFWLKSSPIWINNELRVSRIKQELDGKSIGRPFVYKGNYVNNRRNDPAAKVTLKDCTYRVGPWEGSKPVGDWWSDHAHPPVASETVSLLPSTSMPRSIPSLKMTLEEKVAALQKQNAILSVSLEEKHMSGTQCRICFERQKDVRLSCGHMFCQTCADRFDGVCASCRCRSTSPYRRVFH